MHVINIDYNPFRGHELIPSSICDGLKELRIRNYEGSMSFFTLSVARNLVGLRELCISECDEMIRVIEEEEVASGGERILIFPKLEKLQLEKLPKLVSFCEWKCEVELPSLREVDIGDCPCIREDFSLGVAPNVEAFNTDLNTYFGVGNGVSFYGLKELGINWNKHPFYDHKISVSLFSGLEKLLFIMVKPEGMRLFSCSVAENLVNLRSLNIQYGCDGLLVTIIEDDEQVKDDEKVASTVLFPKLEKLRLDGLRYLMSFCEWKCNVELPSLRKVSIRECPNMEKFSSGFLATPNLQMLQIDNRDIGATEDLNGELHLHFVRNKEKQEEEQEREDAIEEVQTDSSN